MNDFEQCDAVIEKFHDVDDAKKIRITLCTFDGMAYLPVDYAEAFAFAVNIKKCLGGTFDDLAKLYYPDADILSDEQQKELSELISRMLCTECDIEFFYSNSYIHSNGMLFMLTMRKRAPIFEHETSTGTIKSLNYKGYEIDNKHYRCMLDDIVEYRKAGVPVEFVNLSVLDTGEFYELQASDDETSHVEKKYVLAIANAISERKAVLTADDIGNYATWQSLAGWIKMLSDVERFLYDLVEFHVIEEAERVKGNNTTYIYNGEIEIKTEFRIVHNPHKQNLNRSDAE